LIAWFATSRVETWFTPAEMGTANSGTPFSSSLEFRDFRAGEGSVVIVGAGGVGGGLGG
jgi:hypothetical protein